MIHCGFPYLVQGDCANEVETEQIVADTDVSSLTSGTSKQGCVLDPRKRTRCQFIWLFFVSLNSNCNLDTLDIVLWTRLRQGSEHISSFVQLRASVPAHWSQTMTAQPPIYFELNDPYSRTSGKAIKLIWFAYFGNKISI